jgi:hypothetical protein
VENDSIDQLEITSNNTVTFADSVFSQNDSIWQKTRSIPLSEQEKTIYVERDSLEKVISGDTSLSKKRSLWGHLLFYDTPKFSKNKKLRFTPFGVLSKATGEFNTVNGFTAYKTLFQLEWKDKEGKYINFLPTAGYAFARDRFLGNIELLAQYNGKKRAAFFATAGRMTDDYNRDEPMPLLANTISSLIYTKNFKKFYEADFFKIGHQIDLLNGLQLITILDFEDRAAQVNNSSFTLTDWWDFEYTTNTPSNQEVFHNKSLLNNHQSLSADVLVKYTPKQFYRIKNGTKEVLQSKYPTFTANYRQGLENVLGSDANYQFVSFAVQQTLSIRLIDKFSYHVEAGTFLSNSSTLFADYKNFNGQPNIFLSNDFVNSFKLMDLYRFNTNSRYAEAHFRIEDNRILLKRIPYFARKGISEMLNFNYLITEQNINYTEVGYSVDRIFFGMKVGVYAAFEDDEFAAWNVRIGLGGLLSR